MSKSIIKIFNFIFLVLTALLYRVDYCALLLRAGVWGTGRVVLRRPSSQFVPGPLSTQIPEIIGS